ncbi:MAG: hypothetical protein VCD66_19445, partial [Alphaproteobacteria bacterium]
ELTGGAPADLLFFCQSDPAEQLAARMLSQRLLLRLTSRSPDGKLLDVNMGITPYSTRGPIISQVEPFFSLREVYENPMAVLALTQARVISGPAELAGAVARKLMAFLADGAAWQHLSRHAHKIVPLVRAAATKQNWDLRHCSGGLAELQALIAFLQVRAVREETKVVTSNHVGALGTLIAMGYLDESVGKQLIEAYRLMRQADNFLAAAMGVNFDPETATEQVKTALARASGAERFEDVEAMLRNAKSLVGASLGRILTDTA